LSIERIYRSDQRFQGSCTLCVICFWRPRLLKYIINGIVHKRPLRGIHGLELWLGFIPSRLQIAWHEIAEERLTDLDLAHDDERIIESAIRFLGGDETTSHYGLEHYRDSRKMFIEEKK